MAELGLQMVSGCRRGHRREGCEGRHGTSGALAARTTRTLVTPQVRSNDVHASGIELVARMMLQRG